MSAPQRVVFIKADTTLKRRAERGRGVSVEEMQRAAGKVLESHSESGRSQLLAAVADARAAIARWRDGGDRSHLVAGLTAMAQAAESQGRVLGNPLLAEVGRCLVAFVSLFAKTAAAGADSKATTAIELHLDAMLVALDECKRRAAIDDVGRTLLTNLQLTRRTLAVQ